MGIKYKSKFNDDCGKIFPEDSKPIEMRKLSCEAIRETRKKLRELIKAREARQLPQQGPFDEVYYTALSMLESEPLETGLIGRIKLET